MFDFEAFDSIAEDVKALAAAANGRATVRTLDADEAEAFTATALALLHTAAEMGLDAERLHVRADGGSVPNSYRQAPACTIAEIRDGACTIARGYAQRVAHGAGPRLFARIKWTKADGVETYERMKAAFGPSRSGWFTVAEGGV